nr:UDP-2,4-diacetamido-2,4,6-trideoxy-beta-L-altropyranose hydrolase [uncultured Sulfurimonas sp.]
MNKTKNILFRADSSSSIGTGHIMRDLVLAQKYAKKGDHIIFATQELKGNINYKIIKAGYGLIVLQSNDIKELNKLIKKQKINMIVMDHYGIDYKFEKKLKIKNKNLKILSFDDTYEKHHCDILLNHNISADKKRYKGLVPKNCKLKCGSKYTLLRDEFIKEKKKLHKKRFLSTSNYSPTTIFLAMGGADHSNINIKILKVLKKFKNIKVNLVTTTANQNLKELQKYCKNKLWIKLHINSNKIAKLMTKSNFAIVTPSVTVNEVYYLGLPMIAIKTAENQIDIYKYLLDKKYPVIPSYDEKVLYKILKNNFLYKCKLINFIDLKFEEKKMILEWRNNPIIREWMYNQDIISLESHLKYIESLEKSKDKKYFLVKKNNENIGVIDFVNIKKDSANMGIYANPKSKGVGKILLENILKYAFEELKVKKIYAEVFAENKKAYEFYKKFNFKSFNTKKINDKEVICLELKYENR